MAEFLVTRIFAQETEARKCTYIKEATALAKEGDTIILELGEWKEDVEIIGGVTLRGKGARDETILRGSVRVKASNATLSNLTIASEGQCELEEGFRGPGVIAENVENLTIADCVIRDWRPGLQLRGVKGAKVMGSLFHRNQGSGVDLLECENCTVLGNEFEKNSWFAIRLRQSSGNRIEGNDIKFAGWVGIEVAGGSTGNTLAGNSIDGSNLGMTISAADNRIEGNRIDRCNHGVFVGDIPFDRTPQQRAVGEEDTGETRGGNRVIGNLIRDAKRECVIVRRASGTVIEGNRFLRSQGNDIVVVSGGQQIGVNESVGPVLAEVTDLAQGYRVAHQRGRVLWGDTHMHSQTSDASGTVEEGLAYGRDALGLDFVASADHSEAMIADTTRDRWAENVAACKKFHEPGRFLAIPGFELTYPNTWWSHLNIYYADFEGPVFSGADIVAMKLLWEASPPEKALEKLRSIKSRSLIIRHHYFACPVYWDRTVYDDAIIAGADICSIHATVEKDRDIFRNAPWGHPITTVRQALQRGVRTAVMAGSDTHFALPGDYALTAVLTDDFTTDELFDAFFARRTYATTGEKILLEFTVDGHDIGAAFAPERAPVIRAKVQGTAELSSVQVLRDNCVIFSRPGGDFETEFEFEDPEWRNAHFYYLRVVQQDFAQAWTTPIWIDHA